MMNARLVQLGARPLMERGDGDDQHRLGLYGGFIPWITSLSSLLSTMYPLPIGESIQLDSVLPAPSYRIHLKEKMIGGSVVLPSATDAKTEPFPASSKALDHSGYNENSPYISKVISNDRITNEEWTQDVRHIALDATGVSWKPGDIVYIQPRNIEDEVESFLKRIGFTGEELVDQVERMDPEAPLISFSGSNLRNLVSYHLDISGVPRRYFFELLSFFAKDPLQANKLRELSSVEGQEDMNEYARKAKRSFLDVLSDFDSASPPLDYILDLIPKLQPRPFSISSSASSNPSELTLSMVVVKYRSAANRLRRGVCSTWLASTPACGIESARLTTDIVPLIQSTPIPIWIKPGTMVLPSNPSIPLIMIGPGTGCAIFRAFIQERLHLSKTASPALGPAVFYFGCRHESQDFLYRDLWLDGLQNCAISMLSVAFSRDRVAKRYTLSEPLGSTSTQVRTVSTSNYELPANVSSFYVQHCIKQDAAFIWNLISDQGAFVYVCGNSNKMPNDVRKALIMVAMAEGNLSDTEAETLIRNMEAQRRYCVESWA
jgi:sulfite reductase alpha subunit-like flavoprotein